MPNPYNKYNLSPFVEYPEENNTPYQIWNVTPLISAEETTVIARWTKCFGLFRGLPIIPNSSCPDYDKRKATKLPPE